ALALETWPPGHWEPASRSAALARGIRRRHPPLGRRSNALPQKVKGRPDMATYQLTVNGQRRDVNADPSTPLLWVLRDDLKLTGTKYGCGISVCGACTVHLGGVATRSCVVPVSMIADRPVVTIEAMAQDPVGRVVQDAWVAADVVQCGYCQSGQIMSAIALLKQTPKPTDTSIEESMGGNICRCGTYVRIREAIKAASSQLK